MMGGRGCGCTACPQSAHQQDRRVPRGDHGLNEAVNRPADTMMDNFGFGGYYLHHDDVVGWDWNCGWGSVVGGYCYY